MSTFRWRAKPSPGLRGTPGITPRAGSGPPSGCFPHAVKYFVTGGVGVKI